MASEPLHAPAKRTGTFGVIVLCGFILWWLWVFLGGIVASDCHGEDSFGARKVRLCSLLIAVVSSTPQHHKNSIPYFERAVGYAQIGDFEKSHADMTKAVELATRGQLQAMMQGSQSPTASFRKIYQRVTEEDQNKDVVEVWNEVIQKIMN